MRRHSRLLTLVLTAALLVGLFPIAPLGAQSSTQPPVVDAASVDSPPPEAVDVVQPPYVTAPALMLQAAVAPDPLTVGMTATVTLVVSNMVADPADDLVVALPVPMGAEALPDVALVSSTEGWRWNLGHLDGNQSATVTAALRLTSVPPGEALLVHPQATARAVTEPATTTSGAFVTLRPQDLHSPHTPRTIVQPQQGGLLESRDQRVRVTIPPGASDNVLQVRHRTLAEKLPELQAAGEPAPPPYAGMRRGFETFFLEANDRAGRDVHQFKAPLTVAVSYTPEQLLARGLTEGELTLFWFDTTHQTPTPDGRLVGGRWAPLRTEIDPINHVASAQVDHFTPFQLGSGLSASSAFVPSLQNWQTALFTGGASYTYPMEVPRGAGGLAPELTLTYSSDSVDGPAGSRKDSQAGWAGRGWSFEPGGSISRIKSTVSYTNAANLLYDSFTVSVDGRSFDLVRLGVVAGNPSAQDLEAWQWGVVDETFVRVRAEQAATAGYYQWKLWTRDGTRYEFTQALRWGWNLYNNPNPSFETYKWLLTAVVDPSGNKITYTYQVQSTGTAPNIANPTYYLQSISWGYDGATPGTGNPRYTAEMEVVARSTSLSGTVDGTWEWSENQVYTTTGAPHEAWRLESVSIKSKATTSSSFALVKKYDLVYELASNSLQTDFTPSSSTDWQRVLTLKSVQVLGNNGTTALPATTFTYNTTRGSATEPNPGWNRLLAIDNGYGGKVTFIYEHIWTSAQKAYVMGGAWAFRFRVSQALVESGPSGQSYRTDTLTTYAYEEPALNERAYSAMVWYAAYQPGYGGSALGYLTHPELSEFRGHATVTVKTYNGATTAAPLLAQTKHWFYQGDAEPPCTPPLVNGMVDVASTCFQSMLKAETWRGRAYKVEEQDGSSAALRRTTHTFTRIELPFEQSNLSTGYKVAGLWRAFTPEIQTAVELLEGGTTASRRTTTYGYDLNATSDGGQYGNLLSVEERDQNNALIRTTAYSYTTRADTATYIVDRRWQELTRNGANTILSLTHTFYDDQNTTAKSLGTRGLVTRTLGYANLNNATALSGTYQGQDTVTTYDVWGNPLTTSIYAGYGSGTVSGSTWSFSAPGGGSTVRTTTTTYNDNSLHVFPTQVTYPTVGSVTLSEQAGYDYRMGTLTSVTDANGVVTSATYDVLGRLDKLIKNGDSTTYPTEDVDYYDTEKPFRVLVKQRQIAGNSEFRPIQRFYNGLGRLIQEKTEAVNVTTSAGQNIITDTRYNGLGLVVQVAQARYGSETSSTTFYTYTPVPATNVNWATTTYDFLQRPLTVTEPDATVTQYNYSIDTATSLAAVEQVDAKGHRTRSLADSLGRLLRVEEYTGTSSANWVLWATTRYTYDSKDLLTSTMDQLGNTSSLTYDSLGRKASLTDPNIGAWQYTYDANGNLTRQLDSRGRYVCFFYDALDRPTGQQYNGTNATCPVSPTTIAYGYDASSATNFGKGRRTSMSSPSHSVSWRYNQRGQVVEANHTVGGVNRVFTWSYDSADRLVNLTYPAIGTATAETVTTTYDAGWRPRGLCAGTSCLVQDTATWTALGQPDNWTFGDGLLRDWSYDPQMQRLQRLAVTSAGRPTQYDRTYTYDPVGNVATITNHRAGRTDTFTYDHRNRLVQAQTTPMLGGPAGTVLAAQSSTTAAFSDPTALAVTSETSVVGSASMLEAARLTGGEAPDMVQTGKGGAASVPEALPLIFMPNTGQTDPQVQYLSSGLGHSLFFTAEGVTMVLGASGRADDSERGNGNARARGQGREHRGREEGYTITALRYTGTNPATVLSATEPRAERVNSFIGDDPGHWRTDLPTYGTLGYEQLYPGINLRFDGIDGRLKSTYTIAPGADPGQIRWRYDGAQQVTVDAGGNLLVTLPMTVTSKAEGEEASNGRGGQPTSSLTLTEEMPIAWQEQDGLMMPVAVSYAVSTDQEVSFTLGTYDPSLPLLIDPVMTYSSFLGGSGIDSGAAIGVTSTGQAIIAGNTTSTDFPGLGAPVGASDIFVIQLNASGTPITRTLIGGSSFDSMTQGNDDVSKGLAIDSSGNIYVGGLTSSTNFPTTVGAYDRACGADGLCNAGRDDGFVLRLSPGGVLSYSTYLGGANNDRVMGLVLDSTNAVYVTGDAQLGFPLRNAFDTTAAGREAFVSKLNLAGAGDVDLLYSTYLGGEGDDAGLGIAVDSTNSAYVVGVTTSTSYPVRLAAQATQPGGWDGFVTKLTAAGNDLVYSTYLGGTSNDVACGIALDSTGRAYVTGYTLSSDFPLNAPLDSTLGGYEEGFITRLSANGQREFSSFLGGSSDDRGIAVAVASNGDIAIGGQTSAFDFPTYDALSTFFGGRVGFVTVLANGGSSYRLSTAVGATRVTSLMYGSDAALYVAGYNERFNRDVYVARIAMDSQLLDATYTYDVLGNLTNKSGVVLTYGANGNGTGAGSHQARSVGGQPYTYDQAGNLLSGGGRTYVWDDAERLTSVTQGGVTTTYGYNGDGMRVTETVSGVVTIFLEGLWDEQLGTNGRVEQRYVFGGQLIQTKVVTPSSGLTQTQYHFTDHLGSVSSTVGGISTAQDYDPWGLRTSTSSVLSQRRFTGQRQDGTGLLYYNARYYDPAIGRFISADTIVPGSNPLTIWPSDSVASRVWGTSGSGPANPQDLNRYSYGLNNPVRNTDPTGHMPWIFAAAGIGAITNIAIYAGTQLVTGQDITVGGVLSAGVSGAATGALMAVGGPFIGTMIRAVGVSAISTGVGAKIVEGVAAGVASIGVSIAADWVAGSVFEPLGNAAQTWFTGTAPNTSGPDWEKAAAGGLASAPLLIDTEDTWAAMRSSMRQPTPPRYHWDRVAWRSYNARLLTRSGNWRAIAINTVIGVALSAAGSNTWGTARPYYQRQQGPR